MAIKIGNLDINAFKLGSGDTTIYLGDTLLYPTTPPSFQGKFMAEYSDSTSYSADCDSSTELTTATTRAHSTPYSSMTDAVIGDCVTTLGVDLFRDCSGLTKVNSSVNGLFNIPSGITSIGNYAFRSCISATTINLPNSVTTIGTGAFRYCKSLTDIILSSGLTTINNDMFNHCDKLTGVTIPNTITSIGSSAFTRCYRLETIEIPSSVTSIGSAVFNNCSGLTAITINATTPPTLSNANAFSGTNDCPIYVPCESVNAYKAANRWSSLASRIQCVEPSFEGKWKATYSDSHIESAQCDSSSSIDDGEINLSNLVSVEIGDCVTSIGYSVFYKCTSLTSCTIGSGVTSIGDYAFSRCNGLTSINIPNAVTSIGYSAFNSCSSLQSITVNAIVPPTLSGGVFYSTNNCPIYVPSASVEAYKTAWSSYASRIQAIPNS